MPQVFNNSIEINVKDVMLSIKIRNTFRNSLGIGNIISCIYCKKVRNIFRNNPGIAFIDKYVNSGTASGTALTKGNHLGSILGMKNACSYNQGFFRSWPKMVPRNVPEKHALFSNNINDLTFSFLKRVPKCFFNKNLYLAVPEFLPILRIGICILKCISHNVRSKKNGGGFVSAAMWYLYGPIDDLDNHQIMEAIRQIEAQHTAWRKFPMLRERHAVLAAKLKTRQEINKHKAETEQLDLFNLGSGRPTS